MRFSFKAEIYKVGINACVNFRAIFEENKLLLEFRAFVPSRKKEILLYLNYLKTEDA